jgi:ribosomal protein L11 methyltransferase
MPFLQLTLAIGSADPEPFEDALIAAGALSITLEDAADDPVLEPAPGTTPLWPTVRMKGLFAADANSDQILLTLAASLPTPLPQAQFEAIADRAWEREWLKDFRPMRFGARLWVCPAGMRPSPLTLSRKPGEGQLTRIHAHRCIRAPAQQELAEAVFLDLDPGLAFGTGTHPTTALCLEWLDGADLRDKTVIDYGCGSGVLAIAALKLGARSALAVDIDPQAIIATEENALRNGVAERMIALPVDAMPPDAADIVLANILAEPLEQLAPTLNGLVRPGGSIVLSGLLSSQAEQLARLYSTWFHMLPAIERDGWSRLSGTKAAPLR